MSQERILAAAEFMDDFAERTGLSPAGQFSKRYLWTDAYAVCNFLGLYQYFDDVKWRDLALLLVDEVHHVLGWHRSDSQCRGWLSGLSGKEAEDHPTIGGLRIGKSLNECGPDDPYDEYREWDRDGQYYHYLTKWMHALNRVSTVTGDLKYNRWAVELAKAAHRAFVYNAGSRSKRMYWKMSINLSYPLVRSMGHHDPLDGLITYIQLQGTLARDKGRSLSLDLQSEIDDLVNICESRDWQTDDLLGLGSLLCDGFRVTQLFVQGILEGSDMLRIILDASIPGLKYPGRENFLYTPSRFRLAFRELGLSIGLHALEGLDAFIHENLAIFEDDRDIQILLKTLWKFMSIRDRIEAFWLDPSNRKTDTWKEHLDINTVMLATSLAPEGFLTI
ncbi:MAG: hypothetical protein PHT96_11415 [Syntrophorhabdaceae bacterium]|nr:hypothetical protein [Syntrophorhabdaceae bacterium]MDD4196992.1 hypothetical protein [Syntrophorhabdaceae bacterium]